MHVPRTYRRFPDVTVRVPPMLTTLPWLTISTPETDEGPATKLFGLRLPLDSGGWDPLHTDIVVVSDDDSVKRPGWLAGLTRSVRERPDAVAAYTTHRFDPRGPSGAVFGWLGFGFHFGALDLTDALHFKWLQGDACQRSDDHMFSAYFHFRGVPVQPLQVATPEEEIVSSVLALSDTDPLATNVVALPEDARAVSSLNCRLRIWRTTRTDFPFWCCMGCCDPHFVRVYEELRYHVDSGRWRQVREVCASSFPKPNDFAHCLEAYTPETGFVATPPRGKISDGDLAGGGGGTGQVSSAEAALAAGGKRHELKDAL